MQVELGAGTYQAENAPGEAHFDNLNGGVPSAGHWCAASSLQDDFNDNVIGPEWARGFATGGCSFAEQVGQAAMTLTSAGPNECAYVSSTSFDLTNDAAYTKMDQVPRTSVASTYAYLRARAENGDFVEMGEAGSNLLCGQQLGGAFTNFCGSVPYNGATHLYMRLRASNGTLYWETSPDASNWTMQFSKQSPIPLAPLDLSIGGGVSAGVSNPGFARFDSFNLP